MRMFEIEYVRVRVARGWTAKEISARLGRTGRTGRGVHMVYRIAHKNGIRWKRRGPKKNAA